jgi:uncharacterized repeat protein (TIGR03803 family)
LLSSAAVVCAAWLLLERPAQGLEIRVIKGHVPRVIAGLRPLGPVASTRRIDLAIGLPLHNRETLTNLLVQLYDPASPNYRHYLTPRQFAERFGPTEADYQSVIAFAKSNHLVLAGTHPNRMLLDVNGAVADIEQALHLRLRLYQHPTEPRTFYSPDVEPSVDSRVPVLSVAGLDDFSPPRPMDLRSHLTGPGPQPAVLDATGSGPSGAFLGLDFRAAYAPGVSLDGSGESVGLLEFDNYYPGDIEQYEDLAGLPRIPLTNVLVDGFNGPPGLNNGEVALDIQMAISMAPGLSNVIVYEGTVGNDLLNRMATDNQARQLSSSWSFGKQVDPTREQIYQEFAAQGQSMFQASGDGGAYGPTLYPPADDPFVTAVGGTSLTTTRPGGNWMSETAWFGSGGGVSLNYSIPPWQQAVNMAVNRGSTTMRNVPDVAALADAMIWVVANNGQQGTASGTSAAAPLWAGFAALVNQQAATNRQPPIGFINPALYAIGQGPAFSTTFHDIIAGNNTNDVSPDRFYAVAGYDLCTGWGSPAGSNLVNALLAPPDALAVSPSFNEVITGPVGGPFTPALPTLSLTNAGILPLSWSLGSTSSWLNASPAGGTLAPGGPGTILSLALNLAATNLVAGSYVADLSFTNQANGFVQQRQVALAVVEPPVIIGQPANQTLPSGATARFSVRAAPSALLSFQWRVRGTSLVDGGNITGSTTSLLTLSNVNVADAGTYSVVVSNAAGFVPSLGASLSVTSSAPIIAVQPASQTVLPGAKATISVLAFGDQPLSFQWRANGTNLIEGGNVSGSTSSALSLNGISATAAGTYSVIVSNAFGMESSAEAALTVVSLTTPELVQAPVYPFTGGPDGAHPNGLTFGVDGGVYGTTQTGGTNGAGTIFRLDSSGQPKPIYSFTGAADGDRPNSRLVQSFDGTLLGTTFGGGSNGFGTIFKLNTNGALSTLFTLDHTNGVLPTAGLAAGLDGNLYGTAYEGGILHYGTLFRIGTNGTFTTMLPFSGTNGAFPHAGLIQSKDGNFYGTTYKGGVYGNGTLFKVSPRGLLETLVSFDGANGGFPLAGLTEAPDGSFYGTTTYGGVFGFGVVFRMARNGSLTNLVSFTGLADGSHPAAELLQSSDGNLYGTTSDGGSFGVGTVFRLTPAGGLTTIAQFDGFNGANPEAPLLEGQDGSIYGVTPNGGPENEGLIFRLTIPSSPPILTSQPAGTNIYAGSTLTLGVASFGSSPLLYQWQKNGTNLTAAGNLSGVQSRLLTITNVSPADAGGYSVIVSNAFGSAASSEAGVQVLTSTPFFTVQPSNQTLAPGSTAILSATVLGNEPLFYQWRVDGTNLLDAGNLSGSTTGVLTLTNVTQANNGSYTLVVTNALGSVTSTVAVVSIIPVTAPGTSLSTLYSFSGASDGRNPSDLVDGLDGYLYGATQFGGNFREGTLFRVGTNGGINPFVSFNQTNGAFPLAGLVRSANGAFYGTASAGGAFDSGTLFAIDPAGSLTTLYNFNGTTDGSAPAATLVQGVDGNFYGSTTQGGAAGLGTIFQLTAGGSLSTLYSFTGGVDGSAPVGPLVQMTDGAFYGLTASGGSSTNGSVFRINAGGELTTIYSFSGGIDGYDPVGGLVLGDDGYLYGATRYNTIRGYNFYGTFFKLSTNGSFTTLYALNFTDGSYPAAGLILAADGNFYGTTEQGGANDYGTVFRMTPGGAVSTLVEFDGFDDGSFPLTALTATPGGALYGTTSSGGPGGHGTIFRLSFAGAPQITAQPVAQTGFTGESVDFSVAVTGGAPLTFQWQKNGSNLTNAPNVIGANARVLTLSALSLADAGSYSVIVSNSAGSVISTGAALSIKISPPALQASVQTDGILLLAWNTVPGRVYQIQTEAALGPSKWVNLGSPFTAVGTSLATTVPIGPSGQQFYRVVLLP